MIFKALLKIGGSLSKDPNALEKLCNILSKNQINEPILIIPGGGEFADIVRKYDKVYSLSDDQSHFMAIMAMNLMGYLLHSLINNSEIVNDINKLVDENQNNQFIETIPIFLPYKYFKEMDPLPHSWNVTSDSIAYYLSNIVGIEKVILVKDVDGLFNADPKIFANAKLIRDIKASDLIQLRKRTVIDNFICNLINKFKKPCYIVNGKFPERVINVIKGKETIYSKINY